MSLAILTALERISNSELSLSSAEKEKALEFFSLYHSGDWIYPGAVKRWLGISIEKAYRILEHLKDMHCVESWYEFCCGHCQRSLGTVRQFNEIPEVFECDLCGEVLPAMENTIKIYKVL